MNYIRRDIKFTLICQNKTFDMSKDQQVYKEKIRVQKKIKMEQ